MKGTFMSTTKLLFSLSVCPILFLCGCATEPVKWYIRTGPTYSGAIASVDRVGVISDAAVIYDRTTDKDWYSLEDSMVASSNMLFAARRFLEKKGYQVAFTEGPVVGACKSSGQQYKLSEKRRHDPIDRSPPFYVTPAIANDVAYRDAVLRTLQRVELAITDRGELPTETMQSEPSIHEDLKLIRERQAVRYLLVVMGDGKIVSAGKQTGQVVGTALLSTVMTLGMVTVTAHNISFLDSYIGLLDLQTGEMLWTNSLRLGQNPADDGLYKGVWPRMLLYHLPDRAKSKT